MVYLLIVWRVQIIDTSNGLPFDSLESVDIETLVVVYLLIVWRVQIAMVYL